MRYKAHDYARAYLETNPATKDFLRVIEKNGDLSRLDKIVAAIEEVVVRRVGGHMVDLEFARDAEPDLLEKMKKKFGSKDHIRISKNPSLIAGVRVTIDGSKELDESFKRRINTLFT